MKELEITLRVRNNRLKERRVALGMNQTEFAAAAGVSLTTYRQLEALRCLPWSKENDCWCWSKIATDLAVFHCVEPEELWPPAIDDIKQPIAVRRVDVTDLGSLLTTHQKRRIEAPDAAQERRELREKLQGALATLPLRDAEVLHLIFWEEHTMSEIAELLGVSPTRIWMIRNRAIETLRRPSLAKRLLPFHHDEAARAGMSTLAPTAEPLGWLEELCAQRETQRGIGCLEGPVNPANFTAICITKSGDLSEVQVCQSTLWWKERIAASGKLLVGLRGAGEHSTPEHEVTRRRRAWHDDPRGARRQWPDAHAHRGA